MNNITRRYLFGSILISTLFIPPVVFADAALPNPYKGGLKFTDELNKAHWFQIDGLVKLDQVWFAKQNNPRTFHSGSNLRALDVNFSGGLQDNLSFVFETSFNGHRAELGNAFLKYDGFNNHSNVSIGQVAAPFSLENTSSGKWTLFMERSLPIVTFAPDIGLGIQAKWWKETVAFTFAAVQPKYNVNLKGSRGSDPWLTAARAIYSPVHTKDKVYHFGAGVVFKKSPRNEVERVDSTVLRNAQFKAKPEIRTSEPETSLLDTGSFKARHQTILNLEAGAQWGPFQVASEYTKALVTRAVTTNKNVNFEGGHIQASYNLTGESREYDFPNGTFGRIRPSSPDGAWQIAARYSYLNLNNRDIKGGRENNVSVALSWYMNNNVRFLANYIHANIHAKKTLLKHRANIFGLRAQLVW